MYKSDYRPRLEKAIEKYQWPYTKRDVAFHNRYCSEDGEFKPKKIESIEDLLDAFEKRATTEAELRNLFGTMFRLLEPPGCGKTHCKNHGGSFNWCNCAIGKVPGKCSENRAYLKRKREKIIDSTCSQ